MFSPPAWEAKYIGIPFKELGRFPDADGGVDCYGLLCHVFDRELGIKLPHVTDYKTTKHGTRIASLLENDPARKAWTEVPEGCEQTYDAILMKGMFKDSETGLKRSVAMHVAIVVSRGWLLNAERGCQTVMLNYRRDHNLQSRIVGFFRHELVNVNA